MRTFANYSKPAMLCRVLSLACLPALTLAGRTLGAALLARQQEVAHVSSVLDNALRGKPANVFGNHDLMSDLRAASELVRGAVQKQLDGLPLSPDETQALSPSWFFAQCGSYRRLNDVSDLLNELNEDHELHSIGKLAKGGDFFRTSSGRWLIKSLKPAEATTLIDLGKAAIVQEDYGGCNLFNKVLMLPMYIMFSGKDSNTPFVLMQNETARLEHLSEGAWEMAEGGPFDLKPLPNLSDELAKLISMLQESWLAALPSLNLWNGWDVVRDAVKRDSDVLAKHDLVDYSLFVHVMKAVPGRERSGSGLAPEDGCIEAPDGNVLLCFRFIDFLTPYTLGRSWESWYKGNKFEHYSAKTLRMMDCLGNLTSPGCVGYRDYDDIISAGEQDRKAMLFSSETFKESYECKGELPSLEYDNMMAGPNPIRIHSMRPDTSIVATVFKDTRMHDVTSGYNESIAAYLQAQVSPEAGGRVIQGGYADYLRTSHEKGKADALAKSGAPFAMSPRHVNRCVKGVKQFATETTWSTFGGSDNEDLRNILLAPESGRVFVIRGVPKVYSHDAAVKEMRNKLCFLYTAMYTCRPTERGRVVFDYKRTFGSFEILEISPWGYSGEDYKIWANAVKDGHMAPY